MSFNQSRAERSDSSQYRRSGRSGSSTQPRNFSGGSGKGGGGGPAPPPSINLSLSSNRSYKKSNNAQGGQSRGSGAVVNTDSNYASAVRTLQNGAHLQPSAHGAADAPVGVSVKPTADMSTQKSPQAVPKAPSSQPSTVNSDSTAPATPAKGEASKSFPLQFGSISPGFMNGMQIPAQTNSAPPNLDEQQRDQPQGIMHQGQSLNFPPQMGPHMPPQLGNLGIGIGPRFGVQRKPVMITHPDTHEELRLGSSGPRSNANVPQSQPITSVSPAHPITYYANSYNPNSLYFRAPSSVSLTGTRINPSSQVPRFSYPVSQSTPTLPVVNPSTHNSYSDKSSAPSASVQITVKQATWSHVAKIADSSESITGTSSMNLKQVLVDDAQNDVEKARQNKPEPDDWELLKSLFQSWTVD